MGPDVAPPAGVSEGDIKSDSVCGLYLRNCARIVKTVSMSGLGSNGAGRGAHEEPFGGAADAAPGAAAASDAESIVALTGERGGLGAFWRQRS